MRIERRKKSRSIMPVSSMADIAFLLLIFFMVSSVLEMEKEIPVNLPESRISVSETRKYFNIWINSRGELYLDGKRDNLRNLVSFARYRISINADIKALISADRELPFEYINSAMEALKDAGVYNIVLVSKKKER
jgi:biopolymer transport protein ExbD